MPNYIPVTPVTDTPVVEEVAEDRGEMPIRVGCICGCKCPKAAGPGESSYCSWCQAGDCWGWLEEDPDHEPNYLDDDF